MSYDDNWHESSLDQNRKVVRETIRQAGIEELKQIGAECFSKSEEDWMLRFNKFLDQHPRDTFYHAKLLEGAQLVYCHDAGKAIWFLPKIGTGFVQPKGIEALKEIVDSL